MNLVKSSMGFIITCGAVFFLFFIFFVVCIIPSIVLFLSATGKF